MSNKRKVLMVCLGNSCRSPIAEAVFKDKIKEMGLCDLWDADSAALLRYHVGKAPEPRASATLLNHGIKDYSHTAKLIIENDFHTFDWIFGMDSYILQKLYEIQPADSKAKVELLGKYDPQGEINIDDPYFDNDATGFEKAFIQSVRSIEKFLQYHNRKSHLFSNKVVSQYIKFFVAFVLKLSHCYYHFRYSNELIIDNQDIQSRLNEHFKIS